MHGGVKFSNLLVQICTCIIKFTGTNMYLHKIAFWRQDNMLWLCKYHAGYMLLYKPHPLFPSWPHVSSYTSVNMTSVLCEPFSFLVGHWRVSGKHLSVCSAFYRQPLVMAILVYHKHGYGHFSEIISDPYCNKSACVLFK